MEIYSPFLGGVNVLVLLSASLLRVSATGADPSSTPSLAPVNEPLAMKYIDQSCEAENLTRFYLSVRNAHNAERMYPPWDNPAGPNSDISNNPGTEDFWDYGASKSLIPNYDTFFPDVFQYGFPSSYKWCIHLYSIDEDIHGCVRDNITWGTPTFERLGLLDKLAAFNAQDQLRSPMRLMFLELFRINLLSYVNGNDLWHNAMVVFTADWNRADVSSVSSFFLMNTGRSRIQYVRDFPSQGDAFLVAGEKKEFICITFGGYRSLASGWVYGNNISTPMESTKLECVDSHNRSSDCDAVSVKEGFFGVENCVQYNPLIYSFGTITHALTFWNATTEDTGVFSCYVRYRDNDRRGYNQTIHVHVVFAEIPQHNDMLLTNKEGSVKFVAKAPKNSTLILLQNGKILKNFRTADEKATLCDNVPVVHQSSTIIDNFYSLYSAEIEICNVSDKSSGLYECQVHYFVESKEHFAKYEQALVVKSDDKPLSPVAGQSLVLPVSLGVGGGCVVLIAVALGLVVFIWLCTHKTANHRTAHLMSHVPITITSDTDKNKTTLSASNESSAGPMEFLRCNIDSHEQIGKGRFGKVIRASAYWIVPHMPSVNMVAVKTANSKTAHSRKMMLAELDIMKQLDAHQNICNLLAFCTLDDPVLIIMEYACHGNLKQHLGLCSQKVQQSKKSLVVADNDGYLSLHDNDKMQANAPGLITESLLKQCAFQIASGLEHLVCMNIVHRDLAARNILISEDFVLKIGDFGMATTVSDDENYHKIIDDTEVIAVKWAALETLENKGYFFESDVWSFAVIIWEIASYGDEPFQNVAVGLNLEKFIEHLRSGHRLARPPGLSDEIYKMLTQCWAKGVEDRPSATLLKEFFQE